ncbi:sulfotransferase domain-containing protein [Blastococcus colisei]|uniref:Sulfotransferase domain-containing protein n=1 Tax=Blastococcus colisei TaxID=1564162 RepID=A0A543P0G9_9ACTN|nr:sulfotransferase [Blastococcus colisei]TQN37558.1 sulfotransferase domain-containing protein [Blastococcus colisei]
MKRVTDVSPQNLARIQRASVAAGRVTSGLRMMPDFLIVGAQRSGTTSMYRALGQHPNVLRAVLHKGVHYFDVNYGRSLSWYRSHFPTRLSATRVERRTGAPAQTFESSPYYMFHPLAPERIERDLPGVKLLVLVRDPVERAYSAHAHELARGFEAEPFERALELEEGRLRGETERLCDDPGYESHHHRHNAYVTRGQYIDYLEPLADRVGRDRVHVVDSHDFFSRPEDVYDEVLDFLGLPRAGHPPFERHNARPRSAMPEPLRASLTAHYAPYDERLAAWWGRAPSWRR